MPLQAAPTRNVEKIMVMFFGTMGTTSLFHVLIFNEVILGNLSFGLRFRWHTPFDIGYHAFDFFVSLIFLAFFLGKFPRSAFIRNAGIGIAFISSIVFLFDKAWIAIYPFGPVLGLLIGIFSLPFLFIFPILGPLSFAYAYARGLFEAQVSGVSGSPKSGGKKILGLNISSGWRQEVKTATLLVVTAVVSLLIIWVGYTMLTLSNF